MNLAILLSYIVNSMNADPVHTSGRELGHKRPNHNDVIKWKHFPRYWPFVRGIHRSPANSPHKGQWRGALIFSLICAWIHRWVNNRDAEDLRRHGAHYDVNVMIQVLVPHSTRLSTDTAGNTPTETCFLQSFISYWWFKIDRLVQDCSNSSALAMELLQSLH